MENFDINKGIIKTFRLLSSQPGVSIRTFLTGNRDHLTKPFRLLILTTAVTSFLMFQVIPENEFAKGFQQGYNQSAQIDSTAVDFDKTKQLKQQEKVEKFKEKITEYSSKYYNLTILMAIPFMALGSFWFFRKKGYNYAENVVMNAYLTSYQNLIFLLSFPLIYFYQTLGFISSIVFSYIYYFYAYKRFFEMPFWPSFGRSLLSIIVGTTIYMIFLMIFLLLFALFLVKTME